jgi:hypothetical protein
VIYLGSEFWIAGVSGMPGVLEVVDCLPFDGFAVG